MRRSFIISIISVAAVLAACVPQPPPRPPRPELPLPPVVTTSTTSTTSTTTSLPGPATCPGAASGAASGVVLAAGVDEPGALDQAASVAGVDGPVTVTSLDSEGRPVFEVVDGDRALSVALSAAVDDSVELVAVEQVVRARALGGDPLRGVQWALDQVDFEAVWSCSRGAGQIIAVVDTGVDATHPDLAGRVLPGASKLSLGPLAAGGGGQDPNGHGTHVAGIAAAGAGNGVGITGVAPEALVLPFRALGADGGGYDVDVAAGIVWAVDQGADVVNLSLGTPAPTAAMASAVDYAAANNVPVVAAVGNSAAGGALQWPAVYGSTIAVSSFASGGAISPFSTSGPHVDVTAPGSLIASTLPGAKYGYRSGTSMAAPHIAGLVAIMRAVRPGDSSEEIAARLCSTAVDAGAVGFDERFGCGIASPVDALG